jgi:hypothetical protein
MKHKQAAFLHPYVKLCFILLLPPINFFTKALTRQ